MVEASELACLVEAPRSQIARTSAAEKPTSLT